jgi:hypothetical protein
MSKERLMQLPVIDVTRHRKYMIDYDKLEEASFEANFVITGILVEEMNNGVLWFSLIGENNYGVTAYVIE